MSDQKLLPTLEQHVRVNMGLRSTRPRSQQVRGNRSTSLLSDRCASGLRNGSEL